MNHRKKGNLILKARAKKAHAKLVPKKKSSYVSKADRAKLEAEEKAVADQETASDSNTQA
ncbi:DUF2986 domain-containing protein [Leucothrix arctica]|uniref:DUF2986 domain-containing protein n=1 Tax=Leucothrix arctica TaxID=1481894 RepID=A0A317CBS4_9GAMM|nr:DUF2986 domain-containing protein [Leucothrix arctica]PWQ93532.1 DUF2986 domain-containing protein [Leucothrix arctica]